MGVLQIYIYMMMTMKTSEKAAQPSTYASRLCLDLTKYK